LLGHKDIRMTLRYVAVTQQDLQREFQQALRIGRVGRRSQSAQGADPFYDLPEFGIGGNQAFVVQLAQRDVQGPLVWAHLLQAVQRQIEAFADADSAGTREQECIGGQIIGSAQFLLQELILLRRKRTGQVEGLGTSRLLRSFLRARLNLWWKAPKRYASVFFIRQFVRFDRWIVFATDCNTLSHTSVAKASASSEFFSGCSLRACA
jgi:hypothetical protein